MGKRLEVKLNGLQENDHTFPTVWRFPIAVGICEVGGYVASREDGMAVHSSVLVCFSVVRNYTLL